MKLHPLRHWIPSTTVVIVLLGGVLSACSKESGRTDAGNLAKGINQTMSSTVVATDKACKLFSRSDIATALGKDADEGHDWAPGGCEWKSGDDAVQAVVMRTSDWEPVGKDGGGESLTGIGNEAMVSPSLGSFRAGALTASNAVYVQAPTRDVAVKLLRQAVARLPLQ
ncbi:MAG: hypothetical protein ABIP11_07790 [Luteimonas sp.]